VVAKGAKLSVIGRKRGWVKVTNPETSESGWIYAGSKPRRGSAPAAGGDSSQASNSLWPSLSQWLAGP
jgi:hypothetical protein